MTATEFGKMVEAARETKGLTRAVFVKRFDNVSPDYLAAIESGTTNPRLSTVLELCNALDIEIVNKVPA